MLRRCDFASYNINCKALLECENPCCLTSNFEGIIFSLLSLSFADTHQDENNKVAPHISHVCTCNHLFQSSLFFWNVVSKKLMWNIIYYKLLPQKNLLRLSQLFFSMRASQYGDEGKKTLYLQFPDSRQSF